MSEMVYVYNLLGVKVYDKEYGVGAVLYDYETNAEIADFFCHITLEKFLEKCDRIGWLEKND